MSRLALAIGLAIGSTGAPAPSLASASVNYTITARAGGTPFTLSGGANLTGATSLTLGGTACTSVVIVNSTTITAVTPAKTAGLHDLVVTTPGGQATLSNAIEAWDPAVVASCNSWFRAGVNQNVTGALINSLGDQSGAAVEPTLSATLTNRPTYIASGGAGINGLADIAWTATPTTGLIGSSALLGTTAITLFSIFKSTQTLNSRLWGMQFNDFRYELILNKVNGQRGDFGIGTVCFVLPGNTFAISNADGVGALNNGNPHTIIGTWSTADNTIRVYPDGSVVSSLTGTNAATIANSVGVDANAAGCGSANAAHSQFQPFLGNQPEWGSFNAVLSSADRVKLAAYLKSQAGI